MPSWGRSEKFKLVTRFSACLDASMNVCAITMVYKDHWALAQWYYHYGQMVGPENLFVVTHGTDTLVRDICPQAQILQVPRDDLEHFDVRRGQMLNAFQDGLNQYYDWVIRTDADELICFDPHKYGSIASVLNTVSGGAVFALGFDVFEFESDTPMSQGCYALSKRRNIVFSGHYSKAWAVRKRIALKRHGAKMRSKLVSGFEFKMPRGVFLAHLKFANGAALMEANTVRQDVASRDGHGLPGAQWLNPDTLALNAMRRAASLPYKAWPMAEREAWTALQDPVRDIDKGIVRARSIKFENRTELPDWFGEPPAPLISPR